MVIGVGRLGMTMARANRRALSGRTRRDISPSRKWRFQSSGFVSVMKRDIAGGSQGLQRGHSAGETIFGTSSKGCVS